MKRHYFIVFGNQTPQGGVRDEACCPSQGAAASAGLLSPQTTLGHVLKPQNIHQLYFVHKTFDTGYFVIREEAMFPEDCQEYTRQNLTGLGSNISIVLGPTVSSPFL